MRKLQFAVLALGGSWWLAAAQAQEADQDRNQDAQPDLDFLEYLGAWAEEDDEWLAIEEWQKDDAGAEGGRDPEAPKKERDEDDENE